MSKENKRLETMENMKLKRTCAWNNLNMVELKMTAINSSQRKFTCYKYLMKQMTHNLEAS